MNKCPQISIVTPSFNQGQFLEKTILSVIKQGYPYLEYSIIDGGSTDNSIDIIRKYEKHLSYWISEPDQGQSHAINKGFERATGHIFGWLNSDDWYAPGALLSVAKIFRENPEANVVVGAGEMIDEQGKSSLKVARNSITLPSLFNWIEEFFWQPSCFFSKKAWDSCGPLDVNFHYAMDLDLWIKFAKKYSFVTTDTLLSFSLKHEKAKTFEFEYLSRIEAYWVILGHGGETESRRGIERYIKNLIEAIENYKKHDLKLRAANDALREEIINKDMRTELYEKQVIELKEKICAFQKEIDNKGKYG
jgi:glycosyltransferase involved in cell wall biosynthesis